MLADWGKASILSYDQQCTCAGSDRGSSQAFGTEIIKASGSCECSSLSMLFVLVSAFSAAFLPARCC